MSRITGAVVFFLLLAGTSSAADLLTLSPLLDERTILVLRIEPGRVDLDRFLDRLGAGASRSAQAELKKEWGGWLKELDAAGGKELFAALSLADVQAGHPFLAVPLSRGADEKKLTALLGRLTVFDETIAVHRVGTVLVAAPPSIHRRLVTLKAVPRRDIEKALAGAGPVRLVLVPTTDATRILEETVPVLPDELGGGSVRPLARGLRAVILEPEPGKPALRLTVQATDESSAQDLALFFQRALKSLAENRDVRAVVPGLGKLVSAWKAERKKDLLVVRLDEKLVAEVLGRGIARAIEAERQARTSAQMRRLLVALHAHAEDTKLFPAHASHDRTGKPLLSWRVHLLPYLGQRELYRQFKLDEPWDSPHNRKLIARMPAVYRPVSDKLAREHRTTYLAPVGKDTVFPPQRGVSIAEIHDGTGSTILLVDADDSAGVVWTRPDDWMFDSKDPHRRLSTRHDGKIMVGFADGTVRFLPSTITKHNLAGLFTRGLGEVVEIPEE